MRFISALAIAINLLLPVQAFAACTTQTFVINGRVVSCLTCCYGGHCTTTCN